MGGIFSRPRRRDGVAVQRRMDICVSYTANGGRQVRVPSSLDPYRELGLSQGASYGDTKRAYKERANKRGRQERVMASLSYHMITSTSNGRYAKRDGRYEVTNRDDQFFLAAVGHTKSLLRQLRPGDLDERGRTALYIAARSGFYDTARALLEKGAPVNQVQNDGSTALHGAAYYGQVVIVQLLLSHGADPTIKNNWGHIAADETNLNEITKLLIDYNNDKIATIARSLISKGLATCIQDIVSKDGVHIGRKIVRNPESIHSVTQLHWQQRLSEWETCWHGTKSRNIESILKHGLVPSGNKAGDLEIRPPSYHISLGKHCLGTDNWAAAIFVSPSLLYASDACYAELITSCGANWRVVMRVRVRPNCYTEHNSTLLAQYFPVDGEPEVSEYRVATTRDEKIRRVEGNSNAMVSSVNFIKASILEDISTGNLSYQDFMDSFGTIE